MDNINTAAANGNGQGDNGRVQAQLQSLFENNGFPPARARLLASRWRTATDFKYASEQALARTDLSTEEIATLRDRINVALVTILQVEDLARKDLRQPASLAPQSEAPKDAAQGNS